ncbi:MAG TPA: hypothetical protein VEZ90_19185, partial [Blastocatellia bacterium]|nr:hypothetical protein [Blastocatellia bacterium]
SDPGFAPAHKTLAEIYGSSSPFHDAEKQKSESEKLLTICPASRLATRPDPLPEPSNLLDQSDRLLATNGAPDKIIGMTMDALRADEWRNQRMRAFDWYTIDFKLKAKSDLRREYWKAWALQARCYRKSGQMGHASELLASMESRAATVSQKDPSEYWDALVILAHLYIDCKEMDRAAKVIERMRQFSAKQPDPKNTEVLNGLEKLVPSTVPGSQAVTNGRRGVKAERP